MTRRTPIKDRVYAPVEQLIDDHDPLRRVCVSYTGGLVRPDGTIIGDRACRAGVQYAAVAIDGGEVVQALPCLRECLPCALRVWGPRRCERTKGGTP